MKNLDLSPDLDNDSATRRQMGYCSSTRHCALIYPHIPKHVVGSSLCGTMGPMSIQTCSPDQSLLDFLLWGCDKDQVYSTTLSIPLGNLKPLAVCREMLESVWQKIKCCFDVYRTTEEGHIIVPFCTNTLPVVLSLTA